jgi:hypothetical protein
MLPENTPFVTNPTSIPNPAIHPMHVFPVQITSVDVSTDMPWHEVPSAEGDPTQILFATTTPVPFREVVIAPLSATPKPVLLIKFPCINTFDM